jgi:hypothetical protein
MNTLCHCYVYLIKFVSVIFLSLYLHKFGQLFDKDYLFYWYLMPHSTMCQL